MRQKLSLVILCCGLIAVCAFAPATFAQESQQHLKGYYGVHPLNATPQQIEKALSMPGASTLPYWRYNVVSSRDGNSYAGISVGTDPSSNVRSAVAVKVIPLIVKMPNGYTFDPTQPDACAGNGTLSDLQLLMGSPEVQPVDFNFGGTDLGTTQYLDAFQRAEFWNGSPNGGLGVSSNPNQHLHLNFSVVEPVVVDVPTGGGLGWTGFGCGNFGVINIDWFDNGSSTDYLITRVLARLINKGVVGPNDLPVLFMPNVVMAVQSTTPIQNCCILGYHGAYLNSDGSVQTYAPLDFDTTGAFGPAVADTTVISHEVAEWANDPFGGDPTPAWGHVGQQGGCQGNFEVGDPLTGTNMPAITMSNGFTYHLQELAFFSWFYGAPSLAANGWFSANNTFTTDAGAVCQ